jgi:hypothetical protein
MELIVKIRLKVQKAYFLNCSTMSDLNCSTVEIEANIPGWLGLKYGGFELGHLD